MAKKTTADADKADLVAALEKISALAQEALGDAHGHGDEAAPAGADPGDAAHCTPRALPRRLWVAAAETASKVSPANAPVLGSVSAAARALDLDPARIALMVTKYWGPQQRTLTVRFLDSPPAALRTRILSHLNAWADFGGVRFSETRAETGVVRIARVEDGYWSYLGTDVLHIPPEEPTMNLEGFSAFTTEKTFRRVVRHEAGHTLGFPHEHMRRDMVARLDPAKCYAYFRDTQGWDRRTVDQQVLRPLEEASVMASTPDDMSVMCYQLPGSITRDGKPIVGGLDISRTDRAFCTKVYPKGVAPAAAGRDGAGLAAAAAPVGGRDWGEGRDVASPEDALG
jgi:hypothetical protein